jgi:aminomethyltransferase
MGYVETPFSKVGTKVQFEVRKKMVNATVSKMPFVKCNYFTGK